MAKTEKLKLKRTVNVAICDIGLPRSYNSVRGSPEAKLMAESIRLVGLIHPPSLWLTKNKTLVLLTGRVRIAAHEVLWIPMVRCAIYTGSERAAMLTVSHEALFRSHYDPARLVEMADEESELRELYYGRIEKHEVTKRSWND